MKTYQTNNITKPGKFNLQLSLTLHSSQAIKLVNGIETRRGVMGLWAFAKACRNIWQAAKCDDPFADWQLLKIYSALKQAQCYLHQELQNHYHTLQTASHFTHKEIQSTKPINVAIHFTTPYGYLAAELIASFDEFITALILARIIGIQSSKAFRQAVRQAMRAVLRSFNAAFQYKVFEITRADVLAQTEKAFDAQHYFGELPEVILVKKLRSPLAPDLG